MQQPTSPCQPAGEMEEEAADIDGDALAARDCACVGEGFLDPLAPLCFLACGEDEEGFPVTVRCVVVGDVQGKLLICLPAAAWHRKVAKRTVPRGFLSKVIAAAVAAASVADRAVEIPGQAVRVWLGFCEARPSNPFRFPMVCRRSALGPLDLLVPFAEALALLWQHQVAGNASTPVHTANEGADPQGSVPERLLLSSGLWLLLPRPPAWMEAPRQPQSSIPVQRQALPNRLHAPTACNRERCSL